MFAALPRQILFSQFVKASCWILIKLLIKVFNEVEDNWRLEIIKDIVYTFQANLVVKCYDIVHKPHKN